MYFIIMGMSNLYYFIFLNLMKCGVSVFVRLVRKFFLGFVERGNFFSRVLEEF